MSGVDSGGPTDIDSKDAMLKHFESESEEELDAQVEMGSTPGEFHEPSDESSDEEDEPAEADSGEKPVEVKSADKQPAPEQLKPEEQVISAASIDDEFVVKRPEPIANKHENVEQEPAPERRAFIQDEEIEPDVEAVEDPVKPSDQKEEAPAGNDSFWDAAADKTKAAKEAVESTANELVSEESKPQPVPQEAEEPGSQPPPITAATDNPQSLKDKMAKIRGLAAAKMAAGKWGKKVEEKSMNIDKLDQRIHSADTMVADAQPAVAPVKKKKKKKKAKSKQKKQSPVAKAAVPSVDPKDYGLADTSSNMLREASQGSLQDGDLSYDPSGMNSLEREQAENASVYAAALAAVKGVADAAREKRRLAAENAAKEIIRQREEERRLKLEEEERLKQEEISKKKEIARVRAEADKQRKRDRDVQTVLTKLVRQVELDYRDEMRRQEVLDFEIESACFDVLETIYTKIEGEEKLSIGGARSQKEKSRNLHKQFTFVGRGVVELEPEAEVDDTHELEDELQRQEEEEVDSEFAEKERAWLLEQLQEEDKLVREELTKARRQNQLRRMAVLDIWEKGSHWQRITIIKGSGLIKNLTRLQLCAKISFGKDKAEFVMPTEQWTDTFQAWEAYFNDVNALDPLVDTFILVEKLAAVMKVAVENGEQAKMVRMKRAIDSVLAPLSRMDDLTDIASVLDDSIGIVEAFVPCLDAAVFEGEAFLQEQQVAKDTVLELRDVVCTMERMLDHVDAEAKGIVIPLEEIPEYAQEAAREHIRRMTEMNEDEAVAGSDADSEVVAGHSDDDVSVDAEPRAYVDEHLDQESLSVSFGEYQDMLSDHHEEVEYENKPAHEVFEGMIKRPPIVHEMVAPDFGAGSDAQSIGGSTVGGVSVGGSDFGEDDSDIDDDLDLDINSVRTLFDTLGISAKYAVALEEEQVSVADIGRLSAAKLRKLVPSRKARTKISDYLRRRAKQLQAQENQSQRKVLDEEIKLEVLPDNIADLFQTIGVPARYAEVFSTQEIHMSSLPHLTKNILKELIPRSGPRNRLVIFLKSHMPQLKKQRAAFLAKELDRARANRLHTDREYRHWKRRTEEKTRLQKERKEKEGVDQFEWEAKVEEDHRGVFVGRTRQKNRPHKIIDNRFTEAQKMVKEEQWETFLRTAERGHASIEELWYFTHDPLANEAVRDEDFGVTALAEEEFDEEGDGYSPFWHEVRSNAVSAKYKEEQELGRGFTRQASLMPQSAFGGGAEGVTSRQRQCGSAECIIS